MAVAGPAGSLGEGPTSAAHTGCLSPLAGALCAPAHSHPPPGCPCRLSALARELCAGRLVLLLEGGYETAAVGEAVAETFLGLLGCPSREAGVAVELPHPEPLDQVEALIRQLRVVHSL